MMRQALCIVRFCLFLASLCATLFFVDLLCSVNFLQPCVVFLSGQQHATFVTVNACCYVDCFSFLLFWAVGFSERVQAQAAGYCVLC